MVLEKRSTRTELKPTLALLKIFCAALAYKLDLSSIVLFLHVIRSLDTLQVNNRDFSLTRKTKTNQSIMVYWES